MPLPRIPMPPIRVTVYLRLRLKIHVVSNEPVRKRRRGGELEAALLDAAWDELVTRGYEELTYEAVASRAGTSRAVLYRRWPTKRELALAALRRKAPPRAGRSARHRGTARRRARPAGFRRPADGRPRARSAGARRRARTGHGLVGVPGLPQ